MPNDEWQLPYDFDGLAQINRLTGLLGGNVAGGLEVKGSGAIRSYNYVAGSAGWSIDGDGNVEFNDGTFRGDLAAVGGTFTGTVSGGAIEGGTIDIGGNDSTSFHVDADGNMWMGSGDYSTAVFKVSNAGAVVALSMTITGGYININDGFTVAADGAVTFADPADTTAFIRIDVDDWTIGGSNTPALTFQPDSSTYENPAQIYCTTTAFGMLPFLDTTGGTKQRPAFFMNSDTVPYIEWTSDYDAAGTTCKMRFDETGLEMRDGQFFAEPDQGSSAPGYAFEGDADTGMYYGGSSGVMGFSSDASVWLRYDGTSPYSLPIYNTSIASAANVHVNSAGRLRLATSSARFKTDIVRGLSPVGVAAFFDRIQPASFKDKTEGDEHLGFIAEDFAEVDDRLVHRDLEGQVMGIEWNAVTALLWAEVQRLRELVDAR